MTAIAGITDGTTVWLGGDSAGVSGYDLSVRADAKVFASGPWVLGFTGSFRMGQLLRYKLEIPEPPTDGDLMAFMCTTFVDLVRGCLKDGGWSTKSDEREWGGEFLAGVHGRLFRIESDFQVGERADGIYACGCGEDYVFGALHAAEKTGWGLPSERIMLALEAAERFSTGVAGPFTIVQTPDHLAAEAIEAIRAGVATPAQVMEALYPPGPVLSAPPP